MKTDILPNGNLCLSLQHEGDHTLLNELIRQHGCDELGLLEDLLQIGGKRGVNMALKALRPRDIGAWTDTPVLAEKEAVDLDNARLWHYPLKAVLGPSESLRRNGYIEFAPVH